MGRQSRKYYEKGYFYAVFAVFAGFFLAILVERVAIKAQKP